MPFIGTGAVIVELNGRITYASTYFCDLVGVEQDKITGKSCFDFVFPEDLEEAKRRFEANKRPNPEPFRFRLRRSDGAPVWADIQGSPMRTAAGEVYGIQASVTPSKEKQ